MKPLILAVDDSQAIRFMIQTIFGKKYRVVTASDAAAAMYWLSKRTFPDVIISDVKLTGTQDWEFIANLRSSYLYKDIPTVVLSASKDESTDSNCNLYNVEKFFLKPFNPVLLIESIDNVAKLKTVIA